MSKVERVCPICKKVFYVTPSRIKVGGGIYCSRECKGIAATTKIEKTCPVCKKTFYV